MDHRFAQFQRQPLAKVHHELRRDRQDGKPDRSPHHADRIAPRIGPLITAAITQVSAGNWIERNTTHSSSQLRVEAYGSRVLEQPADQPEVERPLIVFAVLLASELRQRADNRLTFQPAGCPF